MRVVATVLTFYPERQKNVQEIVAALSSGTVVPDEIVVHNNNLDRPFYGSACKVVNSWNSMTRGKYFSALMCPADYYLMFDDDIKPGPKTLECLLRHADKTTCISNQGRLLVNGSYSKGRDVWAQEVNAVTVVDSLVGQMQFLSFESILRMLAMEPSVRLKDGEYLYEGEDIFVGLCNRCTVVPMAFDERPVYMDEMGVSLGASVNNYGAMRDRFAKKATDALVNRDIPLLRDAPWRKK